jgi:hypothetical protein
MSTEKQAMLWREEIAQALGKLKGEATLSELYSEIERTHAGKLASNWKSSVRQTLQFCNPESSYYSQKYNLFYRKARGVWGLR